MEEAICCHELYPMKAAIGECCLTAGIHEQLLVTPVAPGGKCLFQGEKRYKGFARRGFSRINSIYSHIASTLNVKQGTVIYLGSAATLHICFTFKID